MSSEEKEKSWPVRMLLAFVRSPVQIALGLGMIYFAFMAFVVGHDSGQYKLLLLAAAAFWVVWVLAKTMLKLLLGLLIAAAVFYAYYRLKM